MARVTVTELMTRPLAERKPDVISHIIFHPNKEAAPFVQGLYAGVPYYTNWIAYSQEGSESADWDRVGTLSDIFMGKSEKGEYWLR